MRLVCEVGMKHCVIQGVPWPGDPLSDDRDEDLGSLVSSRGRLGVY